MINPVAVALQGVGYGSLSVASQGFLGGATEQTLTPGSLLMTMAYGTHFVGEPGTQYITPASLLMTQRGGLHIVTGGNVAARWFWIRVWQPLWTWIDQNVGGNDESDP